MLDTRKGEALMAVIDSGSFEQAASALHLTPSAISQRISALEAELGTPLLVRTKPCRATREGQRLVQYLRRSHLLEAEFMAELRSDQAGPLAVAIAVNNDTLATWLLPELAPFAIEENVLLDVTLDDQDHTYALLTQGEVLAAIASQATAMRGCQVQLLGVMRYRLVAAPAFARRWFPHGLQREQARLAPLMVFDRKDALQGNFLQKSFGLLPGSYPCHHVPASAPFLSAIELGMGYGMIPELQLGERVRNGELVDLAPQSPSDVTLYWHAWRVQSPKLERLSARVVEAARRVLMAV